VSDLFQWAIIAFVVLSIAVHVWKGGAANPQSTGKLGRQVSGLSGQVSDFSGRLSHVEDEIVELKGEAATVKDIQRVEEMIKTARAEMHGHHELSKATNRNVQRIYDIMLEKGLGK
jgi:hypothetical protein